MSPPESKPGLSKSKFVMGLQCLKRLYLYCYHPEFRTEPDAVTRASFERGNVVGEMAERAFPGGALVYEPCWEPQAAREHTRVLMADESVPAVFQGAFGCGDVGIRADIVQRLPGGGWRLIEVKSSRRIYDVHLSDLAIQRYVVAGAGVDVPEACLMLRNLDMPSDGSEVNLDEFFRIEDVTGRIRPLEERIPGLLTEQRHTLDQSSPPEIDPGPHCARPYRCDFYEYCHAKESAP